jgi:hypothetical protein
MDRIRMALVEGLLKGLVKGDNEDRQEEIGQETVKEVFEGMVKSYLLMWTAFFALWEAVYILLQSAVQQKVSHIQSVQSAQSVSVDMSVTPSSSQSEPLPAPERVYMVQAPLPPPGGPNSPYFNGLNVTDFLEWMDLIFDEAGIIESKRPGHTVRYCERTIADYIKADTSYAAKDWEGVKTFLLTEFRSQDEVQQRQTMGFLEALCGKSREKSDDLAHYIRLFRSTAKALEDKEELAKAQKVKLFLRGLPEHMREKAAQAGGLIAEGGKAKELNFDKMVSFVEGKARARRELDLLNNPDNIGELVRDAVSKPVAGSRPSAPGNTVVTLSDKATSSSTVDELTKAMEQLKLASIEHMRETRNLQARVGALATRPTLDPALSRNQVPLAGHSDRAPIEDRYQYLVRNGQCVICEEFGHRQMECLELARLEQEGRCHRVGNRIVPGPIGTNNRPLYFRDNMGTRLSQIEQATSGYQKESNIQQSTAVGSVKSFRLEMDTDEEDDEDIDEEAIYGVAAGRVDKARTSRPGRNQTVINARIEKEKRLPATKGLRLGAYVGAQDEDDAQELQMADQSMGEVQTPPNPAAPPVQKAVRFDSAADKPQKLVKLLSGMDGAAKLARKTLNAEIFEEFTVQDALSVPDVRRIIFSNTQWEIDSENGVPILRPRSAKTQKVDERVSAVGQTHEESEEDVPNGSPTPTLNVEVAGRRCLGMLDTGATINVMGAENALEMGLIVKPLQGQHAVSFDGGKQRILGWLPRVPIRIGSVKVFTDVLVVSAIDPNYGIILGRPFQRRTRCQTWYDEDLTTMIRLFDPENGSCETVMDTGAKATSLN